jgi:hypothetical protein
MRIAYISLHWARTLNSGVGKKIYRQIEAWESLGHRARLFMHSESACDANLLPSEKFFYPTNKGIFQRELGRIYAMKELLYAVKHYKPNIIYLRYGIYVYPVHRLASIAPIIEEITTNDVAQHKGLGLPYNLYNHLTRGLLLSNTSGLVCLSKELMLSPHNAKFKKPIEIIGDGIDINNITPLPVPQNAQPRIAFIGSPGSLWQGIEKLVQLANDFSDISIHIIGYDQIDGHHSLPDNLFLYGYLDEATYTKILATMDCAIGSLALHRIDLDESSPLKTRECLALGLPMVLPYKDTDLNDLNSEFLLEIPNREDNIMTHGRLIRNFAYNMRGKRVKRTIVAPYIDSQHKEKKRIAFFERVIKQIKQQ